MYLSTASYYRRKYACKRVGRLEVRERRSGGDRTTIAISVAARQHSVRIKQLDKSVLRTERTNEHRQHQHLTTMHF